MGQYTEFHMSMRFKEDTPLHVIQALEYMADTSDTAPPAVDNHPLFSTSRWERFMQSDSYYFPVTAHSDFRYDNVSRSYDLTFHASFKNYDKEVALFLDWVKDYNAFDFSGESDDGIQQFVGYIRDEDDIFPALIIFHQTQDGAVEVELKPTG